VNFGVSPNEPLDFVVLSKDPDETLKYILGIKEQSILYINKGIAKAYADFRLKSCVSPKCVTIAAALIGESRDLHRYMNSHGLVQSGQDVLQHLRQSQHNSSFKWSIVISGSKRETAELFILANVPSTIFQDLHLIPSQYQHELTRYNLLAKHDALKFALLNVCKKWRMRLYCATMESKGKGPKIVQDGYPIYDPERWAHSWLEVYID
jgi:hypothetical protein